MKEVKFPAKVTTLHEVLDMIEVELESHDCPAKTVIQVQTCLEEMFINVSKYAYPEQDGYCWITVDTTDSSVSITLSDTGIPFDPLAKKDPDITLSADERPIGGLGIYIVKKMMDAVSYEYKDGHNTFTMVKNW